MSKFTDRQVGTAPVGRTQVEGTTGLYIHVNPDGSVAGFGASLATVAPARWAWGNIQS